MKQGFTFYSLKKNIFGIKKEVEVLNPKKDIKKRKVILKDEEADGFFFETHFNPDIALSDGPNMIKIEDLYKTIEDIFKIQEI